MTIRIDGVFDIECEAWDRFVVGEVLTSEGERFVSRDEDIFWAELRRREGYYWGHHAGRYDSMWALDMAMERGDDPNISPRGSGILQLRIGKLFLCDSAALWPDKLEKISEICDARKMPFPLRCRCGTEGCKGYCAIRRSMPERDYRAVEEYLHGDCEALLQSMLALIERAEADGFDLRATIGTTAWNTAKAWCDLPDCTHELGTYRLIREGYAGGMTMVGRPLAASGHRHDIHASYPAALSRGQLPVGGVVVHTTGRAAGAALRKGRPGVYQCSVHVPDMAYPPLGFRAGDRLLYPTGLVDGAWTALEIEYAESLGCRVVSVRGGASFPRTEAMLRDYAERVWALRARALDGGLKDQAYAAWLKWAANSCTGKLAQKETHDVYEYVRGHACGDGDPVIRRGPHGHLLAWEGTRVAPCAHVEWAAYLTADARIELHRQIQHAEETGDFLYCDTDSVYSSERLTRRIGDDLGEWGYEGEMRAWCALAPKLYRYECTGCAKHPSGGVHVRGKGMPDLSDAGFRALQDGESWVSERGVLGLRTALASEGRIFRRRRLERSHRPYPGWIGGRVLLDDGSTRPPTVAEYEER